MEHPQLHLDVGSYLTLILAPNAPLSLNQPTQASHKSQMAILYGTRAHKVGICHITTKCS